MKEGVVLAILNETHDKFFMHKRGESDSQTGDMLFTAGGVEEGEDYDKTINREIDEELGYVKLKGFPLEIEPPPTSKGGTVLRGFLITEYEGVLPDKILDTGDPTFWVDVNVAAASEVDSVRMIAGAALKIIPHLPFHPQNLKSYGA